MPKLLLASNSVADRRNIAPSAERLVNCYAVPGPQAGKAPFFIRSVPGQRDLASLGGPFLRAMARVEGELYVVANARLWKVAESGAVTSLATVTDDPNTSMVGHRSAVTATAAGAYDLYSGGALTQPGSGRISNVGSVSFLNQYTLLTEKDGREVEWTEAGDPSDRNALYFRTAEGGDDNIIRGLAYGGYFLVFKEYSTEVWYPTGLSGAAAFRRADGGVFDRGLKGFNLVTRTPNGLFFVGDDNVAYVSGVGAPAQVSPPQVNAALAEETPTHCFYYEDRGHQFSAIRFGSRPAWVYDAATGRWHERSSGAAHGPWDIVAAEFCYGQWHLGDRRGRVYRLGLGPWDGNQPLRRTIVTPPFYMEGNPYSISELEITGEFGRYDVEETAPNWVTDQWGVPILDQDGFYITAEQQEPTTTHRRPGRIWARVSKDGGHLFGGIKTKDIGRRGQYGARCRFTAMGQFTDFVMELNLTDPHDVPLLSEANVEVS